MNTFKRTFLDWSTPCLPQVARLVTERWRLEYTIDCSELFIVVGGARAERRLLELLQEEAERCDLYLIPPQIVTPGQLPELLYHCERPTISPCGRIVTWLNALRTLSDSRLRILLPEPPTAGRFLHWYHLAAHVDRLYIELSGAALSFADVAACLRSDFGEHSDFSGFGDERWGVLTELLDIFSLNLDQGELTDIHLERLAKLSQGKLTLDGTLYFVGVLDLPRVTQRMLLQLDAECEFFVYADRELADHFDQFGLPTESGWQACEIPLKTEQLVAVPDRESELRKLIGLIKDFVNHTTPDQLSVGIGDNSLLDAVEAGCAEGDIELFNASGRSMAHTAPGAVFGVAARYLRTRSYTDFGTLVRHQDVYNWLQRWRGEADREQRLPPDLIGLLDAYHMQHLPGKLQRRVPGTDTLAVHAGVLVRAVDELLGELISDSKPLNQWLDPVSDFLVRLYGHRELKRFSYVDQVILEVCDFVVATLADFAIEGLEQNQVICAADVLSLIYEALLEPSVVDTPSAASTEMVGWLELLLDDAPNLLLSGIYEGKVPQNVLGDQFLPNSLRRKLGLQHNEQRAARDAYSLTALCHSRKQLLLILSQRDWSGEPLLPSRLLYRTSDDALQSRIAALFEPSSPQPTSATVGERRRLTRDIVPQLEQEMRVMPVTGFATYLECPYRYYLKHVLRLRSCDDESLELGPALFGTLAHKVLAEFAQSEYAACSDPAPIIDFFSSSLQREYEEQFTQTAVPAVVLQFEQLRARLCEFASWQARWVEAGWEISECESPFDREDLVIDLPNGELMEVQGRIDRIDYNSKSNEWHVIDYKTGDRLRTSNYIYREGEGWSDLQLPLYRRVLRSRLGKDAQIKIGYLSLGAAQSEVDLCEIDMGEPELEEAWECAKNVAAKIAGGEFWPPSEEVYHGDELGTLLRFVRSYHGAELEGDF